jgi:hypothetical protein
VLDPEVVRPHLTAHQRACYEQIVACAQLDSYGRHDLTRDPTAAELILAPIQGGGYGPFFRTLRTSRFFKTHRSKIICYCAGDQVYPSIPGIYPSVRSRWVKAGWACGGHYVSAHIHQHHFEPDVLASGRTWLFSFVGSTKTHPIREAVIRLNHARAYFFDSTPRGSATYWFQRDADTVRAMFARFKQVLGQTKFALCPRGIAPSSIRLFEALEAGCVPVILADQLVLPDGPDWASFCLRVPERQVASVPAVVERAEERFEAMSLLARAAWERHFAPRSTFHQLVEWGGRVMRRLHPRKRRVVESVVRIGEYVSPRNIHTRLRLAAGRG